MIIVENLVKQFELSKKQQRELNVNFSVATAVDNISFNCEPGKVYSLLGPNGAGKTTTLRMLATIFKPTSGKITIGGIDAIKYPQEARRKIGFLTGSTGLYARLTPDEVLKYFADLYQIDKTTFETRRDQLYDLLDMEEFRHKRIGKLSTGMKQKVSICRTMIHDPEVVIFDEPTSGLDVITAENIIKLIDDCRIQGKTVIFSSHIMGEVDMLCDDLAIIDHGKMLYQGTMQEFRSNMQSANITAEFIRLVNESKESK